jgi:hypothetical protein
MSIAIEYTPEKVKRLKYQRAEKNLKALLKDLPAEYQILLDRIGVTIILHEADKTLSDFFWRKIKLNVKDFCSFTYQRGRTLPNQRWALSTLKEEVIHYLDRYLSFTAKPEWEEALLLDRYANNPLRENLFEEQREQDSSEKYQKKSIDDYVAERSIFDKIRDFPRAIDLETKTEWLVDLLLVRDYLQNKTGSAQETETAMLEAFPKTYPLALRFERELLAIASKSGSIEKQLAVLHSKVRE